MPSRALALLWKTFIFATRRRAPLPYTRFARAAMAPEPQVA